MNTAQPGCTKGHGPAVSLEAGARRSSTAPGIAAWWCVRLGTPLRTRRVPWNASAGVVVSLCMGLETKSKHEVAKDSSGFGSRLHWL